MEILMKTRKLLIAILAVVLLAAYCLLGVDYLKQRQEHEALSSKIATANQSLTSIPAPPADLEERLAKAQTGLHAANQTFPDRLNSTHIINSILLLAEDTGVKAIPLITQPWNIQSINDINFSVFRLNISVRGTFSKVSGFLDRLENGEQETLVLEYAAIDSINVPFGGEVAHDDTAQVVAQFDIAVYSRPPAEEINEEGE